MAPQSLAGSPEACVAQLEEETTVATTINGPDGDPDRNFCQCEGAPNHGSTSSMKWEFVPLRPGYEIVPFYVHNVTLSYDYYDTSQALIQGIVWIGVVGGLVLCCGLVFFAWRRAIRHLLHPTDDEGPPSSNY